MDKSNNNKKKIRRAVITVTAQLRKEHIYLETPLEYGSEIAGVLMRCSDHIFQALPQRTSIGSPKDPTTQKRDLEVLRSQ